MVPELPGTHGRMPGFGRFPGKTEARKDAGRAGSLLSQEISGSRFTGHPWGRGRRALRALGSQPDPVGSRPHTVLSLAVTEQRSRCAGPLGSHPHNFPRSFGPGSPEARGRSRRYGPPHPSGLSTSAGHPHPAARLLPEPGAGSGGTPGARPPLRPAPPHRPRAAAWRGGGCRGRLLGAAAAREGGYVRGKGGGSGRRSRTPRRAAGQPQPGAESGAAACAKWEPGRRWPPNAGSRPGGPPPPRGAETWGESAKPRPGPAAGAGVPCGRSRCRRFVAQLIIYPRRELPAEPRWRSELEQNPRRAGPAVRTHRDGGQRRGCAAGSGRGSVGQRSAPGCAVPPAAARALLWLRETWPKLARTVSGVRESVQMSSVLLFLISARMW